jgi:hypothetical protein
MTYHGLSKVQASQAGQMARDGKPITKIRDVLQLDYDIIWAYLNSVGAYSWIGAKSIVTRRLKSLVSESDRTRRQDLADDASHMVDYLYYQGVRQGKTLEKVKKALE